MALEDRSEAPFSRIYELKFNFIKINDECTKGKKNEVDGFIDFDLGERVVLNLTKPYWNTGCIKNIKVL